MVSTYNILYYLIVVHSYSYTGDYDILSYWYEFNSRNRQNTTRRRHVRVIVRIYIYFDLYRGSGAVPSLFSAVIFWRAKRTGWWVGVIFLFFVFPLLFEISNIILRVMSEIEVLCHVRAVFFYIIIIIGTCFGHMI